MKIKRFVGGNLEANGYIIYTKKNGEAYIIDPGYNGKTFLKYIEESDLTISGILLTHHHYDHVGAVDVLRNTLGCPVYLHREDLPYYRGVVDVLLEGGESIPLGMEKLHVLHTPGHTNGGVCYYSADSKVVFTGDTIFDSDVGRIDLEDGSLERMRTSLRDVVDKWQNDVTIYPGHGDAVNMKYVRSVNNEFLEFLE